MPGFARRTVLTCLMGLLLGVAGCGSRDDADRPGPRLHVSTDLHDFGPLWAGEQRECVFTLENRGSEPLEIEDVKRQCGCTTPVFSTRRLAPGASGTMTVGFHPPSLGQMEKTLRLYTNGVERETLFRIRAEGLGLVRLEPSIVRLDGVVPLEGLERELELAVAPDREIVQLSFQIDAPTVTLTALDPLGGARMRVGFRFRGPSAPGEIRESIQIFITTRDRAGREQGIALAQPLHVVGEVRPTAWADPPVIQAGPLRGESRTRRLVLHAARDWSAPREIRVEGIPGGEIRLVPGAAATYEVVIPATGAPGRLVGSLAFDYGEGRVLVVPVHGFRLS